MIDSLALIILQRDYQNQNNFWTFFHTVCGEMHFILRPGFGINLALGFKKVFLCMFTEDNGGGVNCFQVMSITPITLVSTQPSRLYN